MVGNAGLVTGLKYEQLLELFLPYGPIEEIVMLPAKPYCFVVFQDVEVARNAYNNLHGKAKLSSNNSGPLYLIYAENVPASTHKLDFDSKPAGLFLLEEFVSGEEEDLLLNCVKWKNMDHKQALKHRRVTHYGYEFCYDTNNVDKNNPLPGGLPDECRFLENRVNERQSAICYKYPNQVTVNQYQPGQGIPPHVDTHSAFEDPILSLSLGSSVVMDFKHPDGRAVSVFLPRRSLLIMSGESRFSWTHGITPRTTDVVPISSAGLTVLTRGIRTSFTFRTVRKGECYCEYQQQCDSYQRRAHIEMQKTELDFEDVAKNLEKTHVHEVYEEIANHFSDTRHKPWPNVVDFVNNLNIGSTLLDVGCGNGKYFGINTGIFEVGCDRSFKLANVCNGRGFQVFNCNCLSLPLKDKIVDGCISIAVIHHLASQERRLRALREIGRILRPGGKALIYVWAKDQERNKTKSSYLKQDSKSREPMLPDVHSNALGSTADSPGTSSSFLPIHTNRTQFQHKDLLVPWKMKPNIKLKSRDGIDSNQSASTHELTPKDIENPTFMRYYHVFDEGELEMLCELVQDVQIIKSFYDQGNWCVILEKL